MKNTATTDKNMVFVPCARCDGEGGKSFWPMYTCFKCDGLKGEWVEAKVYARRQKARETAAAKRQAAWEVRYAELQARRAENWEAFTAQNPEVAARLLALPESPARAELIRYAQDAEKLYQTWDEMITRLENK